MRIKRFENFGATLRSSRENLVSEFLDASTADDHEFSKEIDRQRYCRYIHAVGCLQYGQRFIDDLEAHYASGVIARPDFSLDPFVAEAISPQATAVAA
jgi:hypothetical protein